MLIFCQKRPFSKKHTALMPIFCKKRSILSKTQCSHVIFSKFSWKTPAVMPILDQKTSILSKLQYYMGQKVNRMPFFFDFSWKNDFSHAHILSKKLQFAKKHIALMPIFCQKNVSSFKNTVLPYYFFQIFHKKPYAVMPKSAQKNVNSVKTTLSYWPKKSIGSSFFPIFHQKTTLLMPIFCLKLSIL